MRKQNLRVLTLIAALLLTLSICLAFSSCENGTTAETTAAETTNADTAAETEPAVDESILKIIGEGTCYATVVRPDADSTSSASVTVAKSVRTALLKYVKTVEITTDWTKDGTHDAEALEILVGLTNYDETTAAYDGLKYGDYKLSVSGNKIVIAGYTEDALDDAADKLIDLFAASAVKGDDDVYTINLEKAAIDATGTSDKTLSAFPTLTGVKMYSYYDPGDNCDELIFTGGSTELFSENLKIFEDSGYKIYTQREINGSSFATLYSDKYTVNFGYYKNENQMRVIMEPYSAKTLIGLEEDNKYEVVTTSQITMLGLEYQNSEGTMVGNGMSILIRLCDGRFIVVDGGFNRQATASLLLSTMKSQSADYIEKTKTITVAAWIITHSHGDHNGMINNKYSTFKNAGVKVENFIVNFMSDTERSRGMSTYTSNWSSGEGGGWSNTYAAATALGATVRVAHVGQIFYFADVAMDVLYTIESYGPDVTNALNATSLIIKMTFTDPTTKKQSTYLSTGDATGMGFKHALSTFGSYMKCDIVQVAHHGYTTWGNSDCTIAAYKTIAPSCVLWPQGSTANPNYLSKDYNKVLIDTSTNPNFKEKYIAGLEGSVITVPMPYEVGNVIVTRP